MIDAVNAKYAVSVSAHNKITNFFFDFRLFVRFVQINSLGKLHCLMKRFVF